MFEASEHSIPACTRAVEEMVFVPATTTVTELPEIVMDEDVFTLMPCLTLSNA
jgi:hypothetical protein